MTWVLTPSLLLLAGLEISSGTPDALCPPLEATREAVEARVGEVTSGIYHLHYTLVRAGERASDVLRVVLSDEQDDVLLTREIPLGAEGCSSAPQAIALVVERYFDRLDYEDPKPPVAPVNAAPQPADAPSPAREVPTEAPARPPEPSRPWSLRASAAANERLQPEVALGLGLSFSPRWMTTLDVAVPLLERSEAWEQTTLSSRRVVAWPAVRASFREGPWHWSIGPAFAVQLEWASAPEAPLAQGRPGVRLLGGVGGMTALSYDLNARLSLELSFRLAGVFTDLTRKFEIEDRHDTLEQVLVPAPVIGGLQFGLTWDF